MHTDIFRIALLLFVIAGFAQAQTRIVPHRVTLKNGKTESFSYNAVDKTIATPLTNADDTPVTLKELTGDNNDEMERIRSQIVQISQKPENKIDKTLASSRS